MQILLESGDPSFSNHGDTAMLLVAEARLRELWPLAEISVVTNQPERLRAICPAVRPLIARYPPWLISAKRTLDRLATSEGVVRLQSAIEAQMKRLWPFRHRKAILQALALSDIYIHSGAGMLADEFAAEATRRLNTFEHAAHMGMRAAIFGQGIGPLTHRYLVKQASAILPSLDLIGVREARYSYPALLSLGVNPARVIVSGDDAIELAFAARKKPVGRDIGVNVRLARHSAFSSSDSQIYGAVRAGLERAARKHEAPLTPIPTSQNDVAAIRNLLKLPQSTTDRALAIASLFEILKRSTRCRVVVAGSYHAAVFALAQGTPVVCLTRSAYYEQKFRGLLEQFGQGCIVVQLDNEDLQSRLSQAIHSAWEMSKAVRPKLLAAAERQIRLGREAYHRFYELVGANSSLSTSGARR